MVERLIDSVASINYPTDKLEIQVLDDSTDETVDIIAAKVALHKENGIDIRHMRRPERVGFKAGALQYGMTTVQRGITLPFSMLTFVPEPDFLLKTLPRLKNPKVGMVQTKVGTFQH